MNKYCSETHLLRYRTRTVEEKNPIALRDFLKRYQTLTYVSSAKLSK